jgi:hypothetical protein
MIDRVKKHQLIYLKNWQAKKMCEDVTFEGYKNKLKGRLFGLLCEKEKDGEWEKFLDSIIIELDGLGANSINWWPLLGKLKSLRYLSYEYFRKTIFECMNLVGGLDTPNELS